MMQLFPEVFSLPVFAGVAVCEVLLLAAVYGGSFFIKTQLFGSTGTKVDDSACDKRPAIIDP